jgi:Zn-dependent protease
MQFDVLYLIFVLVVVLVSITLHEAMHAYAGFWLGDDTAKEHGRLTINPIAHIDPFTTVLLPILLAIAGAPPFGAAKPVPFNPSRVRYGEYGAAIVGAAGPLTNLVLAFIGFVVWHFIDASGALDLFFQAFVIVNLAFFVFNMIPIPPLDGSRVLYAIAPDSIRGVMASVERFGIIVIFAIVLLFYPVLGQFMSSVIEGLLDAFTFIVGGA